jgi:tol-pal system protein YbgF
MKIRWTVLGLLASLSFQALADEPSAKQYQQLQSQVQALELRLNKLDGLLQNQGLLSLLKDVEALKEEVAKLKGQTELNTHALDAQGKRQTDLYQDLDHRLTELASRPAPAAPAQKLADNPEPSASAPPAGTAGQAPSSPSPSTSGAATSNNAASAVTGPGAEPAADPLVESKLYEAALNQFRAANYVGAIAGFKGFAKNYPASSLASNAQYWIGYSYYAMGDYKTALAQQQKLIAAFPQSIKVPDALLNISRCQEELKEASNAKKTLEEIIAKHGGTNAAAIAAKRLATLK